MNARFSFIKFALLALVVFTAGACSDSKEIDNRETEYGYVQIKLFKENVNTRALLKELEYLSDAHKIQLSFQYNNQIIKQTALLSYYDKENAEFGVQTEDIKLLAGKYQLVHYLIYDKIDEEMLYGEPQEEYFIEVKPSQITHSSLGIKVVNRGRVKFDLIKDFSNFTNTRANSRTREYAFSEIKSVQIALQNTSKPNSPIERLRNLKAKKVNDFGEVRLVCDSVITLPAGKYLLKEYVTYSSQKNEANKQLEIKTDFDTPVYYEIKDNETLEAELNVELYETDEYIKDYYALREIWYALDGENWSWYGETYPIGSNWNFDKQIDLWGEQPGVGLHGNGRVAAVTLGQFGPKGAIPEALGQLTEVTELWLGSNMDYVRGDKDFNEESRLNGDFPFRYRLAQADPQHTLLKYRKEELQSIKEAENEYSEFELEVRTYKGLPLPKTTRAQSNMDVVTLTNGITSIPESIGNLKKLTVMYIANGLIETLPASMANLENLTDLEVYNCSKMKKFPDVLAELPALQGLNISRNPQIEDAEMQRGLDKLFTGKGKEEIQLLFCTNNSLTKVPESIKNLVRIGLLDFAENKITSFPSLEGTRPVMLYLEHNQLETLPDNLGDLRDMETLSCSNNKFTQFPNVFRKSEYELINTIIFANNEISEIEGGKENFKGVKCNILDLSGNKFDHFPEEFNVSRSEVVYYMMANNQIDSISTASLKGMYQGTESFDFSFNKLKYLPREFDATNFPYLFGVDLSGNRFEKFPDRPMNSASLTVFRVTYIRDENDNRCLKELPMGLSTHTGLRSFNVKGNDIRSVDRFPYLLNYFNVSDNPNFYMEIPSQYCTNIKFKLVYDKTQNIRGCVGQIETDYQ